MLQQPTYPRTTRTGPIHDGHHGSRAVGLAMSGAIERGCEQAGCEAGSKQRPGMRNSPGAPSRYQGLAPGAQFLETRRGSLAQPGVAEPREVSQDEVIERLGMPAAAPFPSHTGDASDGGAALDRGSGVG